MKMTMILSALCISAAFATPSLANYFHNPHLNLNRNIGSAPSPTPRDVRANRLPQVRRTDPTPTDASADGYMANSQPSQRVAAR